MKKLKPQKYILVKHVIANSVEEAIKNQTKFPVVSCFIEQPEPVQQKEMGF